MRRRLSSLDKVGIGWRPELAAFILSHLDEIDVVEVILDRYLMAPKRALSALRTLASQVEVTYHGVGLGLASSIAVDQISLDRIARLFDVLQPEHWSEHLAFVRAAKIEIGHLAAPPRTLATVDGTLENLFRAKSVIGLPPSLENISTLIDPPGSTMSESEWVTRIVRESKSDFLIDLHNLYANSVNFGIDPSSALMRMPLSHVGHVHLSGGHWIPEPQESESPGVRQRLLDDHVHDVPIAVFGLLAELVSRTERPLTVIIERDGNYPSDEQLLWQIREARRVVTDGRTCRENAYECV